MRKLGPKARHAAKTVANILNESLEFTSFTLSFSKILSIVTASVYVGTFILSWVSHFIGMAIPVELLDYAKEPFVESLRFYFSTKVVENVSKGICSYLYKKMGIEEPKPVVVPTDITDPDMEITNMEDDK